MPQLVDYWQDQRDTNPASVYGLLLCGDASDADAAVFEFVDKYWAQLSDMSGVYCAMTLVAWKSDAATAEIEVSRTPSTGEDTMPTALKEMYTQTSWRLGGKGVYSLAQALGVDLSRMPVALLTSRPWSSKKLLDLSLLPFATDSGDESEARPVGLDGFFATLFTACNRASEKGERWRLRTVRREMSDLYATGPGIADRLIGSGVIAQVVEGVAEAVLRTQGGSPG
jgi:hypothetical protein